MILDPKKLERSYLLRLKGIRDDKVYVGPQTVGIAVDHGCNLKCQYCWSHAPGAPHNFEKTDALSLGRFCEIINECLELKVEEVFLSGFGEPTMHPHFPEMMRYIEDKALFIKLYTNGTFPLSYCSDVIRADYVNIHLSATNRSQYIDLHGQDFFHRVMANIRQLVLLRDTKKPGFRIVINYIINAMNVDQEKEMEKMGLELGVDEVYFEKVAYASGELALEKGAIPKLGSKRVSPVCVDAWFFIGAMAQGYFSICPWIYQMHSHQNKLDQGPIKFNALREGTLKEIWFSKHMMRVRLLEKYGYFKKHFDACQDCIFYEKNIKHFRDSQILFKKENP